MAEGPMALRFDRFTLDRRDERLIGPEGPIRIGNKAYRVLGALLDARGQLLTKDVLFESVWDGTIVSESALTSVIKELRRALGDDPKKPRFIESAYGRGYRFLAPVLDPEPAEPEGPAARPAPHLELPPQPSIAVLPFTFGADVEDWFADGLVEEIVIGLTRFHLLFVIAASSSLTFRDTERDTRAICAQLGVRYLLEGTVRRAGNRVRVTSRLVDGLEERSIWAEKYDGTDDDIFDLNDRIAFAVAGRIASSLDDIETIRLTARPPRSGDLGALWARGNAQLRRMQPASLREAIGIAHEMLALDGNHAWAASLAAVCHGLLVNMQWSEDPAADRAGAIAMSERALQTPGEDERVLGFCGTALICAGGDFAVGARLINRAIEINPGYTGALMWGGWTDLVAGNPARGLDRLESMLRLNPLSDVRPLTLFPLGVCQLLVGQAEEAALSLFEAAQSAPHAGVLAALTAAWHHAGRPDRAREALARCDAHPGSWGGLELLTNPAHGALIRDALAAVRATMETAT